MKQRRVEREEKEKKVKIMNAWLLFEVLTQKLICCRKHWIEK